MKISLPKFVKQCAAAMVGLHPSIVGIRRSEMGPVLVLDRKAFLNLPPSPVPYRDSAATLQYELTKIADARLKERGLQTAFPSVSPIAAVEYSEE